MKIEGYSEIDQDDDFAKSKIMEYTNIKGKIIKDAFKGISKSGYDIMEIRFIDGTTLQILEKGQTGQFDAWVYG